MSSNPLSTINILILCGGFGKRLQPIVSDRQKVLADVTGQPFITFILDQISYKSDTFMVFNGDSYCDTNPQDLLAWHFMKNSSCTLALVKMPDVSRYGSVDFDSNYMVTSFDEKTSDKKCGWINAGIYCISRKIIEALPGNRNISLEKDVFPTLIDKQFFAFPKEEKFIDIGTPNSYKEAETFFM